MNIQKGSKYILVLLTITFLIGCTSNSIEDCSCKQINIYGHPSSELTSKRVSLESVLEQEPINIKDGETIDLLLTEISRLERDEINGKIGNRFVLEFYCQNRRKIYFESNSYSSKIDGQSFRPTKKFLDLIISLTKNQYCHKTVFEELGDAATNPECVKTLYLRNLELKEIPTVIFEFSNLEELDLSLNLISKVPNEIEHLSNLKTLHLSYNMIDSISSKISELKHLEGLWLLDNELEKIPTGLCELDKLRVINLNLNKLKELTKCISSIDSLRNLFIEIEDEQLDQIKSQAEELMKMNNRLSIKM